MKKLLALLLMALLLIPALAMAESNPTIPSSIDVDTVLDDIKQGKSTPYQVSLNYKTGARTLTSITLNNTSLPVFQPGYFSASYYLSGQLNFCNYVYSYGSGSCSIQYSPNGAIRNAVYYDEFGQSEYMWTAEARAWLDQKTRQPVDFDCNVFDRTQFPYPSPIGTITWTNACPENDLLAVLKKYGYNLSDMDQLRGLVNSFSKNGDTTVSSQVDISTNKSFYLVRSYFGDKPIYAYYESDNLIEWYIGPVAIKVKRGSEIWAIGVKDFGLDTSSRYFVENGKLMEYTIYHSDRSMVAGYTSKNVLKSFETWEADGSYWGSFDGKWWYSAGGDPEENGVEKTPPSEILEKVLHAPSSVNYDSKCVTSEQASSSSFDSEGVPYIIASGMDNVTPNITATQEKDNLRATTFDIDLKDSQGNDVQPASPVTLTLAYPAGMSQSIVNAGGYDMVVIHNNNDLMSTVAGDVKLTKNGPQVTATSFSPYTVIWGTADELREMFPGGVPERTAAAPNLPQTGDTSNLALYAVLLTLSVGALAVLLAAGKRRASR